MQKLVGPNVSFANAVFSGTDPMQIGSFTSSTVPNIGISSGVILATGDALIAEDTPNNCTAGTSLGGGGDADYLALASNQPMTLELLNLIFRFPLIR